jgi:hypothetical protein
MAKLSTFAMPRMHHQLDKQVIAPLHFRNKVNPDQWSVFTEERSSRVAHLHKN